MKSYVVSFVVCLLCKVSVKEVVVTCDRYTTMSPVPISPFAAVTVTNGIWEKAGLNKFVSATFAHDLSE